MDARTIEQLEAITRERLDDTGTTRPRWSQAAIWRALNEGQREAALRGRLLRDDVTNRTLLTVVPEQVEYKLNRAIFEVIEVRDNITGAPLHATSRFQLGQRDCRWRERRAAKSDSWFIDVTPSEQLVLHLVDIPTEVPDEPWQLRMDVYRLPWDEMEAGDEPEIAPRHHEHLVEWACYRCFDMRDPDTYDPVKAREHLATFTETFGAKPDANVHRKQREKPRHTTVARSF